MSTLTKFVMAVAVTSLIAAAPASATFPGKNGKLAANHWNYNTCCSQEAPWSARSISLITINSDGSARSVLADRDEGEALWSPDGSQLAFLSRLPTSCCYW